MKLLAIHSVGNTTKESAVDVWRIQRPLRELAKHVDWQIDSQEKIIPNIDAYKDLSEFTEEEMEKAAKQLGTYDIVYSSYFSNPTDYLIMKVVHGRYGTKFVMDVDDDLFAINPDNPFWTKSRHEDVWRMQNMLKDATWLTTTTEILANRLRERREQSKDSVTVLPNLMPDDYQHPVFDNNPWVVVGYFGGASHFQDLHNSEVLPALQKLMHTYKNVRFKSIAMPVDHYLPVKRNDYMDGQRGTRWVTDVFPTFNMDIGIMPILDNTFNHAKSNIKWMEYTRAGAATVCSDIGAYHELPDDVTMKVSNKSEEWYDALEKLVVDASYRKQLIQKATEELSKQQLEDNWRLYKNFFEKVQNS